MRCRFASLKCGSYLFPIPYISPADLRAARTVSTLQSYYGNRINREEGFVSERVVNNDVKARMIANADLFTMQQKDSKNQWKDRIYFDAAAGKYVIDGDVSITALQEINEEIEDMGGGASNLYEWIRDGQYKMTSSEFNIMMKADADYTSFYNNMCVGEGSVKYKADYVFSAEGFNAKLTANNRFTTAEGNASSAKSTAEYIASAEGFNAKLTANNRFITAEGNASSAKSTAEYIASAEGFNVMLQANTDYTQAKTTIAATASGLSSKVEANGVISAINQSSESVTINANKINLSGASIDLTGKTSVNNKVVIGNDGKLTADSATITNASVTGTLTNGQWTFNGTGSEYKKGGIGCTVSMLTGGAGMAGGGSDYRAFYGSSGCDVQYGSDYFYQTIIRGRNIKIISQVDGASDFRSAEFKKIAGANDMTFVCGESTGQGSESGNLGCSDQPWDTLWCRKQHRGESDSTYSSREIKKDIHDMPEMGVVLDQLNPVTFRYTWDKDDASLKHGLIYEDTVTVFPDICEAPDPTGKHGAPYGSIMYEELITVLLKETQSLRRRVKELEDVA